MCVQWFKCLITLLFVLHHSSSLVACIRCFCLINKIEGPNPNLLPSKKCVWKMWIWTRTTYPAESKHLRSRYSPSPFSESKHVRGIQTKHCRVFAYLTLLKETKLLYAFLQIHIFNLKFVRQVFQCNWDQMFRPSQWITGWNERLRNSFRSWSLEGSIISKTTTGI